MVALYVPILPAKKGEFRALKELRSSVKDKIIPLFELPEKKKDAIFIEPIIQRTAIAAGKHWKNSPAFLDISKWASNAKTENSIHVLEYAFSQFIENGIDLSPVIRYDQWDDPSYQLAQNNLVLFYKNNPCIRIDKQSIKNDIPDEDYFIERLNEILNDLDISSSDCYVVLDFQDISKSAITDIIDMAENGIALLKSIGFQKIIITGGTMPASVTGAVNEKDSEGCVARNEIIAWKAIYKNLHDKRIIFGDYAIRNVIAAEGVIALHANAKIRYTIKNQYFIVRGHSKAVDSYTDQHKQLALKLISSIHYAKPTYSWGDKEIQNCAIGILEIREPTTMISIDTNHHITVVVDEIIETHTSKIFQHVI